MDSGAVRSSIRRSLIPVVTALVLLAGPAAAHTGETGTSPERGAELTSPPTEVSVSFDDTLLEKGAQLVARDEQGTEIALGAPTVDGRVVSADWPATAAEGEFTVAYRVSASDGHPLQGRLEFAITASPEPSQSPSLVADPSPASEPTEDDADVAMSPWLALGGLAAVLLVGAGIVFGRGRSR